MMLLNIVYSVQMVIRLDKVNFCQQVKALLLLSNFIAFNFQNICRFLTKKFSIFYLDFYKNYDGLVLVCILADEEFFYPIFDK